MTRTPERDNRFVSRGGVKLDAALDAFGLDVSGFTCVDLGANVGGFTDCLLQRGAALVYAVDTAYGQLAWKLRTDRRVVVLERANALRVPVPEAVEQAGVDLAVIDLGWTPQRLAIPAALRWRPRRIITLIKPHYESTHAGGRAPQLDEADARNVANQVIEQLPAMGVKVVGVIASPIRGGAGKGKHGNYEYLALLEHPANG